MDQTELVRISREGLSNELPEKLGSVAEWCWDWCETTGDGRYCSLAETLRAIEQWWSEHSMVPAALVSEMDGLLTTQLPPVLDAEKPAEGARLARRLRQSVTALLVPPGEWPS